MTKLGPENVCIVQMGHYGDIINILPIAWHLHNQGKKVWWLVEPKYRDIFEATSYVEPVTDIDCSKSFREMIRQSVMKFETVLLGGMWDFQVQGEPLCQSYSVEQWRTAGYLQEFYNPEFKLVLDKLPSELSKEAADMICDWVLEKTGSYALPPIIANVTHGLSSPFPYGAYLLQKIQAAFPGQVLDIGALRLPKFLDLVHLIAAAKCLVTIDTGTLWIAQHCKHVPTVAIVSHHKWGSSVLRRPIQARMTYQEAQYEPATVVNAIANVMGIKPEAGWQKAGVPVKPAKWPKCFERGSINGESDVQLRYDAINAWQEVLEGALPCIWFDRTMKLIASHLDVKTSDLIEFSGQRKPEGRPKLP